MVPDNDSPFEEVVGCGLWISGFIFERCTHRLSVGISLPET